MFEDLFWLLAKHLFSLREPIGSHRFKNILFELLTLELRLCLICKMMKILYICSERVSRTFAELFFLTDSRHMHRKITIDLHSVEIYFYGFSQAVFRNTI